MCFELQNKSKFNYSFVHSVSLGYIVSSFHFFCVHTFEYSFRFFTIKQLLLPYNKNEKKTTNSTPQPRTNSYDTMHDDDDDNESIAMTLNFFISIVVVVDSICFLFLVFISFEFVLMI